MLMILISNTVSDYLWNAFIHIADLLIMVLVSDDLFLIMYCNKYLMFMNLMIKIVLQNIFDIILVRLSINNLI